MDFSAEWKSRWPISSTFTPPLLLSDKNPDTYLGPLIFNVKPNSPASQLLQSASLAPGLPPPFPNLPLFKLLQNHDSLPSAAASLSSVLSPLLPDYSSHFHGFNSLQLLQIPSRNLVIAFFPAGENSDRVGFSLIQVRDGILSVDSKRGVFFQLAEEGCDSRIRITQILVNPIDDDDSDCEFEGSDCRKNKNIVGFLMVSTTFSVYWYKIGISSPNGCMTLPVFLDYVGCCSSNMLDGNVVASLSWSPHMREECLVLLENGDLLLFDVNCASPKKSKLMSLAGAKNSIVSKKLHLSLSSMVKLGKKENGGEGGWFGCEFSWHPRIFIASNRNRIFLVDLRPGGEFNICCLLKLEMIATVKNDEFMVLSRAGTNGFLFSVATRSLLLLCDVRKPLIPVLRWAHGLPNPHYMAVVKLSELRANAEDTRQKLASESGHCILLGSFWDSEFSLFCYGPNIFRNTSVYSEVETFCNSYYAWGLPSELSLSGCDCNCNCGSCLVREEFFKASLPVWTDWRLKKLLVTGFGILQSDLAATLSTPTGFGGFTLIRLMSSGKLEAQQFHAAWESRNSSEFIHRKPDTILDENLLYARGGSEYKGEKRYRYLEFEYLNAYLDDELASFITNRREKFEDKGADRERKCVSLKFKVEHELCARLEASGIPRTRSSVTASDVLKDITFPTSIHEIALRSTFSKLPNSILQLAFSTYSDFPKEFSKDQEPLEFLGLPDQLQVPPFPLRKPSRRSNKWSRKVQPSDALVGPLLPHQFLTVLHKLIAVEAKMERNLLQEETDAAFSADSLFELQCEKVREAVDNSLDSDFVSLADDADDCYAKNAKFAYHKPSAFVENVPNVGSKKPGYENDIFSTLVFRKRQELTSDLSSEMVTKELFDVGCPIELKFDDTVHEFGLKELELFRNLKKQDLDFQKRFKPYQDYISSNQNRPK